MDNQNGWTELVPFEIVGDVLTVEDWRTAGSFQKACEGRIYPIEIEEKIYEDFAWSVPQKSTARTKLIEACEYWGKDLNISFLNGEPVDHFMGQPRYAAFFYEAKTQKHFYAGLFSITR